MLLLIWIKMHQRGRSSYYKTGTEVSSTKEFNGKINNIVYSHHAKQRMECRHIDESEVKEILVNGNVNYNRVEENKKGKTYPVEGITHDKQHVRIVFAPHENELVVVTVIDLDKEWDCEGILTD